MWESASFHSSFLGLRPGANVILAAGLMDDIGAKIYEAFNPRRMPQWTLSLPPRSGWLRVSCFLFDDKLQATHAR